MRKTFVAHFCALAALACVLGSTHQASAAVQSGKASWYAMTTITASGERANPNAMVAAHRSLPFGTCVNVKNMRNGRSVVVRINDRGPFIKGRVIDLSRVAATRLGFMQAGTTPVRIKTIGRKGC